MIADLMPAHNGFTHMIRDKPVTVQLKIRISQSHGLTLILECAIGEAIAKESLIRFECPLIIGKSEAKRS